jgi:hypothetical protein
VTMTVTVAVTVTVLLLRDQNEAQAGSFKRAKFSALFKFRVTCQ